MNVLFTAWNYEVTFLEFASVVASILAVGLGIIGTRWAWPFWILGSVLYGWLFLEFDLLASAALQLIFIAAAVWGWFGWGSKGAQPQFLANKSRSYWLLFALIAWAGLNPLLKELGAVATYLDSFIFVGSFVAQVLMVKERIDAWIVWIAVDVVGTIHYARQELYFTALFYALLVVMAIQGWMRWTRMQQKISAA
jgi:nicotinamide mononucleotide transporter